MESLRQALRSPLSPPPKGIGRQANTLVLSVLSKLLFTALH
jgi:hypothetical protein